jgi:hypothetical protein
MSGKSEAKYGLQEVDIFYPLQKITSKIKKKAGYFPKTCHHTKRQYHVLNGATDGLTSSHVCHFGVSYSIKIELGRLGDVYPYRFILAYLNNPVLLSVIIKQIKNSKTGFRRCRWPCGLKRRYEAASLLGSRVRIPPRARIFVSCVCHALCG